MPVPLGGKPRFHHPKGAPNTEQIFNAKGNRCVLRFTELMCVPNKHLSLYFDMNLSGYMSVISSVLAFCPSVTLKRRSYEGLAPP